MPRVKRGVSALKKRRKILRYTKGFRWGRKNKERLAKEALLHAWSHAFQGRKNRKRNFRSLWQTKINAAVRQENITYQRFLHQLKTVNIKLNRKMLAELAEHEPQVFKQLVAQLGKVEEMSPKVNR